MAALDRPYRKKLASPGLIFIGGEEVVVSLVNLSMTGSLVELQDNSTIQNINDVFKCIMESLLIDMYLPEMCLAGEAEVVRAEMVKGHIHLALKFRNISYQVSKFLIKRKVYRKVMSVSGQIILNEKKYQFLTKNVSVNGLMILVNEYIEVDKDTLTIFDFKRLQIRGRVRVVWCNHIDNHSTLMGLYFDYLENKGFIGISRFSTKTS